MEHLSKTYDSKAVRSFYNAPTAKSGIFTTVIQQPRQNNDFKKSCIEHLPGFYNRVDLAGKLDFVVVFQTIEIQRLSVQVENLRVLLKDAERQITNYLNYQVQIKQMSQSCHQLEEKLANYQAQLQKMSLACNALYEEGSQAKKAHEKEIDQMKRQFINLKNEMQGQNDQWRDKHQQLEDALRQNMIAQQENQRKNKLISQQLVRLNQNLLLGQNQIGELRENYASKQEQLQKCIHQLKNCQQNAVAQKQNRLKSQGNAKMLQENLQNLCSQLQNVAFQKQRVEKQVKDHGEYIEKTHKQLDNRGQIIEQLTSQVQQSEKQLISLKKVLDDVVGKVQVQKNSNLNLKKQLQSLGAQCQQLKKQSQTKQSNIKQLNRAINGLTTQLGNVRNRSEELSRIIDDLKNRIEAGTFEITKCKQIFKAFDAKMKQAMMRQEQLLGQIAQLSQVVNDNNQLKNAIFELNSKITQKDDQLFAKDQHITDLTIQNKEIFHQGQLLKNSVNLLTQNLEQLQKTIDRERIAFQSQKSKLSQEYQKILGKQKEDKAKIEKQLSQLKEEGLIHDSTKKDLSKLKQTCQNQAKQISIMNGVLQTIPKIVGRLKQKHKQYGQVQATNETLRKQLCNSISMNQQLIEKISEQLVQISHLIDENINLQEKLREERDKNDDFIQVKTSQKTLFSTQDTELPQPTFINQPSMKSKIQSQINPQTQSPAFTKFEEKYIQSITSPLSTNLQESNPQKSASPFKSRYQQLYAQTTQPPISRRYQESSYSQKSSTPFDTNFEKQYSKKYQTPVMNKLEQSYNQKTQQPSQYKFQQSYSQKVQPSGNKIQESYSQKNQSSFLSKSQTPYNFPGRQRTSAAQSHAATLIMQRPKIQSMINYDTSSFKNGKNSIIETRGTSPLTGLNGLSLGKKTTSDSVSVTSGSANGQLMFKTAGLGEGVLYESKRILQPSSNIPSRQSNLTYRESSSSAYEQFKRDRRI